MVNDVNTLNGALTELGETLATNLQSMGVTASANDGLTTLANKITSIAPSVGGITLTTSITMSKTPNTVYNGDNVLLSATVHADYDDTSTSDVDLNGYLQGATVTFKNGNTVLGTGVTGNDGVATYTLSNVSVGSYNITASFDGTGTDYDSCTGSLAFTVEHNYSLEFSQSEYVAENGSATLECSLLDNGFVVSGETVSLTGSDGSQYTSITNTNGVATFTVSVTVETSFSASYQTSTANCSVVTYYFLDNCSSDNTSQYTDVTINSSSNSILKSYNSTENAYKVYGTGGDRFRALLIPNIRGKDNIKISIRVKLTNTSAYNQLFIGVSDSITQTSSVVTLDFCRIRGDNLSDYLHNSSGNEVSGSSASTNVANKYVTLVMEKTGTTITMKVYDTDETTLLRTYTYSSANNYTNPYYWFGMNTRYTSDIKYIKEIKAEPL